MTFQSHILLDEFLRSCPALDFDWATVSPWFFFFFSNSVVDLLECLGSLSCAKFSENQTAYKHEDLIQAAKYRTIVEGWWSEAWTLCSHWAHRELSIQKDDQFQPRISCQRDGLTFDCRIFWDTKELWYVVCGFWQTWDCGLWPNTHFGFMCPKHIVPEILWFVQI